MWRALRAGCATRALPVYMPSLFGRDGAVPQAEEGAAVFQRACVSAEFRAFAANVIEPRDAMAARAGAAARTRNAAGRAWARSACASPATSRSR